MYDYERELLFTNIQYALTVSTAVNHVTAVETVNLLKTCFYVMPIQQLTHYTVAIMNTEKTFNLRFFEKNFGRTRIEIYLSGLNIQGQCR